uniref:U-box domain-containing protein n=1 Tax=Nelumbo nucifera TaxID=4432 RepID=A0A822YXV9_NELNU|nr:TPA_asm: hypothetical protein HUJ06_006226 [Nelumbo nucifera]
MKTHHPKLKSPPRPLFSCGIFSYCTQTVLSPTTTQTPTLPEPASDTPPPPLPPPPPPPQLSTPPSRPHPESESSSSSTSQSFTQWRFPLPQSPVVHHYASAELDAPLESTSAQLPKALPETDTPLPLVSNLEELFHVAELQFSTGSDSARLSALHLLERSLVPNPPADGSRDPTCPPSVMSGVVRFLKDPAGAKPATKVLLALCLAECNRHVAVEAGAVAEVVETVAELEGSAAERALAALELLCTVPEGASELRAHALAVPMLVEMVTKMAGRGKEHGISVLAVIFGGGGEKGAQILKVLQENGRLDLTEDGR